MSLGNYWYPWPHYASGQDHRYTDSGAAMERSLENRRWREWGDRLRQELQIKKDEKEKFDRSLEDRRREEAVDKAADDWKHKGHDAEEELAWQATINQIVDGWNSKHRKKEDDDTMGTDQNPQKTASQEQVGGDHYLKMGVQPWDVIDNGPIVQAIGYYRWTALAYLMRAGTKDPLLQDLKKAKHVLSKLIELVEGKEPPK